MTMLEALREAVAAKIAYWDAMGVLEETFGFKDGDVPDKADRAMFEMVENLAMGASETNVVTEDHVCSLLGEIDAHD